MNIRIIISNFGSFNREKKQKEKGKERKKEEKKRKEYLKEKNALFIYFSIQLKKKSQILYPDELIFKIFLLTKQTNCKKLQRTASHLFDPTKFIRI